MKESFIFVLNNKKKLATLLISIFILGILIAGCISSENKEVSVSSGSVYSNSSISNNLEHLVEEYNPPQIEGFLKEIKNTDLKEDGNITITPAIKREFNQMGIDYHFFFLPEVDWYDFEFQGAALSYMLFTWTGEFGVFPESVPKYEMEARLQKVFAAHNDEYPSIEHKSYPKFVLFDGQLYSPWPESYNDATMIYDLTDLRIKNEGEYTYYTALTNEYMFDVKGCYEPGENEKFLSAQAEVLGLNYRDTLVKLLETGKIREASESGTYEIQFRVKEGSPIPMIVSFKMI